MIINSTIAYFLLVLPFGIYSVCSFTQFYFHKKRFKKVEPLIDLGNVKSILETRTAVLTFLPAPSLRLGIFTGDGKEVGEIRDMKFSLLRWYLPFFLDRFYPKSYGFYNTDNMLQYVFTLKGNVIEIKNKQKKLISQVIENETIKRSVLQFQYGDKHIMMKKSLSYSEINFQREEGFSLANIKKGWMPKEWTNRFMNRNFPLLTIDHHATDKEIIHLYAIITKIYAYTNH